MILDSRALPSPRGTCALGPLHCAWEFEPLGGPRGGDLLLLDARRDAVDFLIADASGHGPPAALIWDILGRRLDDIWDRFTSGPAHAAAFRAAAAAFDEGLRGLSDARLNARELCLAMGRWRVADRTLHFANFGYGTHVLPRVDGGPWGAPPEALFGLKLGWLAPAARDRAPRGLVHHELRGVDRLILMTDALLGDDFADIPATLTAISAWHAQLCLRPFEELLPSLRARAPQVADDLTLLALELRAEGEK